MIKVSAKAAKTPAPGERQGHPPEGAGRAGAQVASDLDLLVTHVLQRGVDGEDRQRDEEIDQGDGRGDAAEEEEAQRLGDDSQRQERGVDDPFVAEDRAPGVDADQVAGEEGTTTRKSNGSW